MIRSQSRAPRRAAGRRLVALLAGAATVGGALVAAQPAAAEETPWLNVTDDRIAVFNVPNDFIQDTFGDVSHAVIEGNFGPSANWAELGLTHQGDNWWVPVGPLEPGLYYYQLTADDTRVVKDPTNPTSVTSEPEWSTFLVPGDSARLLADVPPDQGGTVETMTYDSTVAGEQRSALVWTPPGYDPERSQAYPVFYLQHGGGQSYTDWVEMGRAKQILDNLSIRGQIEPMVVVMGNGNVSDFQTELLENIVPAARANFNISDDPARQALAGLSMGGGQTMRTLFDEPGEFAYIGCFSGAPRTDIGDIDAGAINDGTTLLRIYTGNPTDIAHNPTYRLITQFDEVGVEYEFDGVNPDVGHNWDAWQENLIDFAPRLFHTVADHGPEAGHLPLEQEFTTPAPGTAPTPWLSENNFVTFETPVGYQDAQHVTVWANFAPGGAWTRTELSRHGDRWRGTVGPLEPGFYYYKFIVDGVDVKDPANPTTVTSEPKWSTFFVPGESAGLLADAPAGQAGTIEEMTYESAVAGEQRTALVWTPPDYDPNRSEPYPVFYLQHGGGQSYTDWVEMGRAKQILDNLSIRGDLTPMVVVMGNGNVSDFQKELLENLAPAARSNFNISDEPSQQALAGLSMGGFQTLTTLLAHPGEFGSIGAFSGGLFFGHDPISAEEVQAINEGTKLLRIYSGNITDFAYESVMDTMALFDDLGIDYQFAGITQGPHGWDTWQKNLIDFAPRLFKSGKNSDGVPIEATITQGAKGSLSMTVAASGNGVTLGSVGNTGDRLRLAGSLPDVTVTDSRNDVQAGDGGWTVSGQSTAFHSDGNSISANHLGWSPTVKTARAGVSAGDPVRTVIDSGPGLATPQRLAQATADGRFGTTVLGADLYLEVPVDTEAGSYSGSLTVSLFPVD